MSSRNPSKLEGKLKKIKLRTLFLNKKDEYNLIETHFGEGEMWKNLYSKLNINKHVYFDIDTNIKYPGLMHGDCKELIKKIDTEDFNVIDIDTFKLEFNTYSEIIKNLKGKDYIVFLTFGLEVFRYKMKVKGSIIDADYFLENKNGDLIAEFKDLDYYTFKLKKLFERFNYEVKDLKFINYKTAVRYVGLRIEKK